jgi:RimJ/RimL family protein N-acetyltransferase
MAEERSPVRLEPWEPGDLALLRALHGDAAMMAHLGGPESEEKLRDRLARYAEPGSGMFKVIDLGSGEPAGSVGFWERHWRGEDVYEGGWSVLPAFQGRGVALAAVETMIESARGQSDGRALHAFPATENGPSNAICRKLGFTLIEEREFEFPPGHFIRCHDWRLELQGEAGRLQRNNT